MKRSMPIFFFTITAFVWACSDDASPPGADSVAPPSDGPTTAKDNGPAADGPAGACASFDPSGCPTECATCLATRCCGEIQACEQVPVCATCLDESAFTAECDALDEGQKVQFCLITSDCEIPAGVECASCFGKS